MKKPIVLILFLALAIRLIYVFSFSNQLPQTYDGRVFDDFAMNIIEKKQFCLSPDNPEWQAFYKVKGSLSWRPPLYPFFLASIYKIFGHSFMAVRIIEAFIGTFTVLLVYIIGLRFFNKTSALIASFIIATYPSFIQFTGNFMRATLFTFLITCLAYYIMKISHKKLTAYWAYILIGILLGAITLLQPTILLFVPFFLIALWFNYKKIAFKVFTISFASMLLIVLPWTIRNYKVHHKFVLITTSGGAALLQGNNLNSTAGPAPKTRDKDKPSWPDLSLEQRNLLETLNESDLNKQYYKWGLMYIRENPLRTLKEALKKGLSFWFDSYGSYKTPYGFTVRVFDAFLLIFGFLGIFYSLRAWRKYLMAYFLILSFTLVPMIFLVVVRYRFPIIPLLSLFAAYGVVALKEKKVKVFAILFTAIIAIGYLFHHILRLIERL